MRLNITPEPALLGYLLGGPVHGYDLHRQVERDLGVVWRLSLSQLYAIVKTFEARHWIETQLRLQDTRPSQKLLEITPAGRQAFADWLDQPAHGLRELRVDFFVRLHFARLNGHPLAKRLVDQQIAACRQELENLRTRRARAEESDLAQLALSFRIQQLVGITGWLERHRNQLSTPVRSDSPTRQRTARRSGTKTRGPNIAHKEP